jgi:hypothetical protein
MLQPVQRSNLTLTHSTLTTCQINQAHSVACGIVASGLIAPKRRLNGSGRYVKAAFSPAQPGHFTHRPLPKLF